MITQKYSTAGPLWNASTCYRWITGKYWYWERFHAMVLSCSTTKHSCWMQVRRRKQPFPHGKLSSTVDLCPQHKYLAPSLGAKFGQYNLHICSVKWSAVSFFPKSSQKTPHTSPVRERYGVSFVGWNIALYSASHTADMYAISCYIGRYYNGTRLQYYFYLHIACKYNSWFLSNVMCRMWRGLIKLELIARLGRRRCCIIGG